MKTRKGIYFESIGSGEPIVLISGLSADHFFWSAVVEYLKQYFTVITIDNRGIGQSDIFEPECTTQLMATDVIGVLDHLNIKNAYVVGHSLGGCIAQMLAILHPERVNKLILCSTYAKLNHVRRLSIENMLNLMKSNVPHELIIKTAMASLFSNQFLSDLKNQELFIKNALTIPFEIARKIYFYQANALLKHDSSTRLDQIKSATLVMCGEEDILAPMQNSCYLAEKINAKLISINGAAHMFPMESPKNFSDYILNFIL